MASLLGEEPLTLTHELDLIAFGQRLRHLRKQRGLTLADLGERVNRAPSQLSLLENGKREPKLSLLKSLAAALGVPVEELMRRQAPNRRAQLEIALEEAQRDPIYTGLGLPRLKVSARVPNDVLEHILALYEELKAREAKGTATPEEARAANAELRAGQREKGNYFAEIERAAAEALSAVGYRSGALSQSTVLALVTHFGYTVHTVQDLPT